MRIGIKIEGNGEMENIAANSIFNWRVKYFNEDNMFTRMNRIAQLEELDETYRALQYMRERHEGQFRKPNKYSDEQVLYINHPLLMACQAHALGIKDDNLLAAILLHDVIEDTNVTKEELPFCDEVREIVDTVSFSIPDGITREEAKKIYYDKIRQNGKACVVKLIDRCNNVSSMAGSFSKTKMEEYIYETESYVMPLADILKHRFPEYADAAFLVKYQLIGMLETIKYLLVE